MKALVTGATGFIGSHLVELLAANGWQVRGLCRDPAKEKVLEKFGAQPARGDLADVASLRKSVQGVDCVFHLASRVTDWGRWKDFEETTVTGTRNLLEASADEGVQRFVHFSTVNVYDDRFARRNRVLTERAPHGPRGDRHYGHYARSKTLAERLVWRYHHEGRIQATVLRPALVYGPRDESVLPRLIDYLRSPLATWIGRGNPVVDPIEVSDVVRCALAAATSATAIGKAYNVAPDCEIGVRDFYQALCQALDLPAPRRTIPYWLIAALTIVVENSARLARFKNPPLVTWAGLSNFTEDRHHDPTRAFNDLGWRASVTLADGMHKYARWLEGVQAREEPAAHVNNRKPPVWRPIENLARP